MCYLLNDFEYYFELGEYLRKSDIFNYALIKVLNLIIFPTVHTVRKLCPCLKALQVCKVYYSPVPQKCDPSPTEGY